jgi:protein O-GlcNAc transferase
MAKSRKERRAAEAKQRKSGGKVPSSQEIQQAMTVALHLHQSGNLTEAAALYEKIIQVAPNNPDTLHLLGVLSYQKGKSAQAIKMIQKAIGLSSNNAAYYNNLGNALVADGQLKNAITAYKKALSLRPEYPGAINNLCAVLHETGEWAEEMQYFKQGIKIAPHDFVLLNEMVKSMREACVWENLDEYTEQLVAAARDAIAANKPAPITPYHALTLPLEPAFKKQIAESYAVNNFGGIQPAFDHNRPQNEKIRIGYVSADYRDHPTAHLINGLFTEHNRNEFEIYAYSYGKDDGSEYRKSIEQNSNFVDCFSASTADIATRIYNDKIDILVDLMGYIQNANAAVFALRPAPVQISYLAYPGTMGAKFIDYLITDHVAVPEENAADYSEKLLFMPETYFITDDSQKIAETPTRAECALPEGTFVFCSFNKSSKIDRAVFTCWMEILKGVPDSVLWLFSDNKFVQDNLRASASAQGVDASRLIFAGRLPKEQHLARHKHADLFLDCFTVNAHTTAIDSLWAGVPVVTKAGGDIMSRASASILSAAGLPELITETESEYKALAIKYATDQKLLAELKAKLQDNIKNSALFNTKNYVKNLEQLFVAAYQSSVSNKTETLTTAH